MIKYDSDGTISYLLGKAICEALEIPVITDTAAADMFAGGSQLASSTLEYELKGKKAYIWGAGFLRNPNQYAQKRLQRILADKTILAVRGDLSKEWLARLGIENTAVIGDLYLLTSLVFPKTVEKNGKTLVVTDNRELSELQSKFNSVDFLSTSTSDVTAFLDTLVKYSKVYSTSISAISIAHSYGIQAAYLRTEPFKKNDKFFKIEDYYTQFSTSFQVFNQPSGAILFSPSTTAVEEIQKRLLKALPAELVSAKVTSLLEPPAQTEHNVFVTDRTKTVTVTVSSNKIDNVWSFAADALGITTADIETISIGVPDDVEMEYTDGESWTIEDDQYIIVDKKAVVQDGDGAVDDEL